MMFKTNILQCSQFILKLSIIYHFCHKDQLIKVVFFTYQGDVFLLITHVSMYLGSTCHFFCNTHYVCVFIGNDNDMSQ